MKKGARFGRGRLLLLLVLGVGAALALAAFALAGGRSTRAQAHPKAKDHYTFVVSNNFLGNDYRPQLLRLATLTAGLPPFKGKVTVKVVESQPTTAAQLADLNNIIREHPDAILLEPPDPTAVNSAIKRACDAGIIVIDVDQAATEKCAWTVAEDFYHAQYILGQWMAHALHGKGSIFVDEGLAGPDIAKTIKTGFLDGLKFAGPNIKVIGTYAGQFANAPSQQAVSSLLVGHRDVNGVMNQGYCTPVINALTSAGLKPLPVTCYGYNGEMVACVQRRLHVRRLDGSPDRDPDRHEDRVRHSRGKGEPAKGQGDPEPGMDLRDGQGVVSPEEDVRNSGRPAEGRQVRHEAAPARHRLLGSPGRNGNALYTARLQGQRPRRCRKVERALPSAARSSTRGRHGGLLARAR